MIVQLSHARMIPTTSQLLSRHIYNIQNFGVFFTPDKDTFSKLFNILTPASRVKSDGYLLIGQIFAHGHKAEKTSLRVTQSKSFAAKLSPYLENTVEETYMTR